MSLIKETGAIVANANTYATAAELTTWAGERQVTVPTATADLEALLLKAMDYLERYASRWKGYPVSADQALAWPRSGVYADYQLLDSDAIPRQLWYAQMQLAITAYTTDLMPVQAANAQGPVIENTVQGAVTRRYANPGKVLPVAADASADALLSILLRSHLTLLKRA